MPRALALIPPGRGALRRALEACGCGVVESERTGRGMGASLAAAIAAAGDAGGWVVALGDMPCIRPATIARVRRAIEGGALIAAPASRDGRRGHPVGFAASLRGELEALDGDRGARELLRRHGATVALLRCDDPGIHFDVDVREDLDRAPG